MKHTTKPGGQTFSLKGFDQRASHCTISHYGRGQAIFSHGDAADAIFRVEEGNVKLTVGSAGGKKAVIAVLRTGECFGEGCLLGNSQRTTTTTSIRRSAVGRVSKRTMIRRLQREPALARLFINHLLLRVGRVEDDLADQLLNSSERRLARLLLHLCALGRPSGPAPAFAHIDQGTLAQLVGTTRSRVSYFMNRFRKKGLIDYNGRVHVRKGLRAFLQQEYPPA